MPRKNLLIYGLQRSGTHYLEALLRKRFKVNILNHEGGGSDPRQRHFRPYNEKELVPDPAFHNDYKIDRLADLEQALELKPAPDAFLILSKNPYAWYLSYCRYAYQQNWPEVDHNYIEEYNRFYGKWLQLAEGEHRVHLVKYGDLLREPEAVLGELQGALRLEKRAFPWLVWLPRRIRRVLRHFSDRRRKYYLGEHFYGDIDPWEMSKINEGIDPELVRALGYTPYPGAAANVDQS